MNRLADETSRYLRQHAGQPVDWWPWGPEALAEARRRDVPVFVSVGYSACHWCHVMAHESFDDPEVAAVLNAGFVSVKVDREERPDVDAVYMEALLATNGHGGWPMSVFTTPDGRPFFCGTYFPRRDRQGMPGFDRVLGAVAEAWADRRAQVEEQATALAEAVARRTGAPPGLGGTGTGGADVTATPEVVALDTPADPLAGAAVALAGAAAELVGRLDPRFGGFGPAPKFPQPALLDLLLVHHTRTGDPESLRAVTVTLGAMAAGGIYDHLAGGFARYATDETWTVPHFEKMLYDQAGLVRAYLHAWQLTGDQRWRQVVEETVDFVLAELALPDGGLAAAFDADSEGEEGRFAVWSDDELRAVLGDTYGAVAAWYQADGAPAFEGRHVLRRPPGAELARPPEVDEGRRRLRAARSRRVPPGRDDKVVTEWNAMFVAALAEASGALRRPDWAAAALRTGTFLWERVRQPGTDRLLRTWQAGRARHAGCATDLAWAVDAFTRLAELSGRPVWLERAGAVAADLLARFRDASGLLAMTAADAEPLVARPVEVLDGATPSASAVAAAALERLGALTGDAGASDAGRVMAARLLAAAGAHPLAVAQGLAAATLAAEGTTEVVVTARREEMAAVVRERFDPTVVLAFGERTDSPLWTDRPDDGRAYVCRGTACLAPADGPGDLTDRLRAARSGQLPAGRSR